MISRKPMARPFQKWVSRVIMSIRENGKYELEKYMEEVESVNGELVLANNNYLTAIQNEAFKFKEEIKKNKTSMLC